MHAAMSLASGSPNGVVPEMPSAANPAGTTLTPAQRLDVLREMMGEAFVALDAQGRIRELNGRAATLLGLPPEQLTGREPWTAQPTLAGTALHERLMAALTTREEARFLAELPPRTWLEVTVRPVGEETWVLAQDITRRHQAEDEVARTEERFRQLGERFQVALDSAQMAVWETNLATGQVFRSEGHDRLYGYPEPLKEWTHEKFIASLHPDDRPEVEAQVTGIFHNDVKSYTSTFRTRWPDGTWHWLTSRATVMRDAQGKPMVVRGAMLDITTLKETELALQEAVRVREDFLSLASHELKTPLTGLLLQMQMLRRMEAEAGSTPLDSPKMRARLEAIERLLRRSSLLVDNLLDVGRMRQGKLDFLFATGDLSALVSELVERTRDEARLAGVSLTADILPSLVGRFDRLRLEQVVINLLANALRHGGGQPMEVRLERISEGARLVVRDEGPGIPEADRERIFARFEQVKGVARAGGLGLGLFIVRQIVEGHRGRVHVEPGPGGRGAAFVVELPL